MSKPAELINRGLEQLIKDAGYPDGTVLTDAVIAFGVQRVDESDVYYQASYSIMPGTTSWAAVGLLDVARMLIDVDLEGEDD